MSRRYREVFWCHFLRKGPKRRPWSEVKEVLSRYFRRVGFLEKGALDKPVFSLVTEGNACYQNR